MKKVLAIIPARGGSKSIPDKNIAILAGKPLIAWTIIEALKSRSLDRMIVSTDCCRIAEISREYGAEVPFVRPSEFAGDLTPGIAPIIHAVTWLRENEGYQPDYVMCLQPTSPLRTVEDIEATIEMIQQKDVDSVISMTTSDHHPYWMKAISQDGRIIDFLPKDTLITRRQDLPKVYAYNGAIYLVKYGVLLDLGTWHTDRAYAYLMPPERSIDIDSPWDLHLVDLILKHPKDNGNHKNQ